MSSSGRIYLKKFIASKVQLNDKCYDFHFSCFYSCLEMWKFPFSTMSCIRCFAAWYFTIWAFDCVCLLIRARPPLISTLHTIQNVFLTLLITKSSISNHCYLNLKFLTILKSYYYYSAYLSIFYIGKIVNDKSNSQILSTVKLLYSNNEYSQQKS